MSKSLSRYRAAVWTGSICLSAFASASLWGQSSFSSRPGFIYHVEGEAAIISYSGSEARAKRFHHLRAGQHLRTQAGRVELMLAPGLILRTAEKTEIKMVKAHPGDLQLRLIAGSAALQVVSNSHLDSLSIHSGDSTVKFRSLGLYRLDAPAGESPQLKVFGGQATVFAYGVEHKVKKKWSLAFAEPDNRTILAQFDPSQKDSFDQWHRERTTVLEASQRNYLLFHVPHRVHRLGRELENAKRQRWANSWMFRSK